MDLDKFKSELCKASISVDKERMNNVLDLSISKLNEEGLFKGHMNAIIVMEELAELAQAISKQLRKKNDRYTDNLLEELADVCICTQYIKKIFNINDVVLNKAINVKVKELEETLSSVSE